MSPTAHRWKMEKQCADCPFATKGAGVKLRRSLGAGRFAGILRDLRAGRHFICHKTTDETGNGTNLVCAGSMEWQNARGLSSNYQRMCERLDYARAAASPSPRDGNQ